MLYFEVVVYPQRVEVKTVLEPLKSYDVSALVDGEQWLYRIKKSPTGRMALAWRGRGLQTAHYHAKNSGERVTFQEVRYVTKAQKNKIHPDQIKLF